MIHKRSTASEGSVKTNFMYSSYQNLCLKYIELRVKSKYKICVRNIELK